MHRDRTVYEPTGRKRTLANETCRLSTDTGDDCGRNQARDVFIDTSAYTVKRYPPELVQHIRRHGRRKVLFGTNYTMIAPAKALEGLDDLGLDAEARSLFLGGNAERVFKL